MSDYLRLVAGDLVRARAIASSAGAGDASKLVMTNGSGVLDASLVSGLIPARGALDLFTLATMPSPAANTGRLIYVSDAPSNPSVCFSDGTLWRKVSDRSAVYRPGTGPQSLFSALSTTTAFTRGWTSPQVQVGVRVTVSTPGILTAFKYFRTAASTFTITGRIFHENGTMLGSAVFPTGSSSGWISVAPSTPVEMLPGVRYMIGVTAPNQYGQITNGLASSITAGTLTALAGVANGAEWADGNTAPSTYGGQSHNYLRDLTFEPYGT